MLFESPPLTTKDTVKSVIDVPQSAKIEDTTGASLISTFRLTKSSIQVPAPVKVYV